MAQYNPTTKTVVTEVKSFVVDAVRKTSAVRNTVSAKLEDDQVIEQKDINVGATLYSLGSVNKHLILTSSDDIEVEIRQVQEVITYPVVTHTGVFSVPNSIIAGSNLVVALTDEDLSAIPTVIVTVVNSNTDEVENLILTRQPNTSTFVGVLPTVSNNTGVNNDNSLSVVPDNIIHIYYDDMENSGGVVQTVSAFVQVVAAPTHTGVLRFDTSFVPGSPLRMSIYDLDRAVDIQALVTNARTNEQELVTLSEIIAGSGLFQYDLPTTDTALAGTDNDDSLNVQVSDVITLQYNDTVNAQGQSEALTTSFIVGTQTFTTGTLTLLPCRAGEPINVQLTDPDRHTNVIISLVNQTTNEVEDLVLTEISPLSGIFTGQLPTVAATDIWYKGTDQDGTMNVKNTDIVRVIYNDITSSSGNPVLVSYDLSISPALPLPSPPDPIITEEVVIVKMLTKLFVFNGSAENTSISIRKPDSNTDTYVRCSVLLI